MTEQPVCFVGYSASDFVGSAFTGVHSLLLLLLEQSLFDSNFPGAAYLIAAAYVAATGHDEPRRAPGENQDGKDS